MLLPITHYLYLALALFGVGLGGALLRRSVVVALLSIQLMFAAVALLLCGYARLFGDMHGQLVALVVVLVGLVELAIGVAVVARAAMAEPDGGRILDDWQAGGPG